MKMVMATVPIVPNKVSCISAITEEILVHLFRCLGHRICEYLQIANQQSSSNSCSFHLQADPSSNLKKVISLAKH